MSTSATSSSSLQRAVQQSQRTGTFESSFAAGLDLSEFGGTTTTTSHKSAAAQLLEQKQRESHQAAKQEQEDVRLQCLARNKARELHAQQACTDEPIRHTAPSLSVTNNSNNNNNNNNKATEVMETASISATLIHLHGTDVNGKYHKAKSNKKNRSGRRRIPSTAKDKADSKRTKKVSPAKKAKRSKH